MRISDWGSDGCSSDLARGRDRTDARAHDGRRPAGADRPRRSGERHPRRRGAAEHDGAGMTDTAARPQLRPPAVPLWVSIGLIPIVNLVLALLEIGRAHV